MKFFTRPTRKRFERTAWLIAQQMHTWLPALAAAPMVWGDTRFAHSDGNGNAPFHFAGYLARAVPGKTWLELKTAINDNSIFFPQDCRWRCVCDLLSALSVLEQEEIVHGDLSPNNIVIDVETRPGQPALYLIDFDAFVAHAAGENGAVSVAEGGTYGTEGYCPPELAAAAADGGGSVAPCSDRYGRDMLLMELLLMDCGLPADDPPSAWSPERLCQRYLAAGPLRSGRFAAMVPLGPGTTLCPGRAGPADLDGACRRPGIAANQGTAAAGSRACGPLLRWRSAGPWPPFMMSTLFDNGGPHGRAWARSTSSFPGVGAVRRLIRPIGRLGKISSRQSFFCCRQFSS